MKRWHCTKVEFPYALDRELEEIQKSVPGQTFKIVDRVIWVTSEHPEGGYFLIVWYE